MSEVQKHLAKNPQLSSFVNFHIKTKGDQDKTRLSKLARFERPDAETLQLLEQQGPLWRQHPETVWLSPIPLDRPELDPQTQVVDYFLRTHQGDA